MFSGHRDGATSERPGQVRSRSWARDAPRDTAGSRALERLGCIDSRRGDGCSRAGLGTPGRRGSSGKSHPIKDHLIYPKSLDSPSAARAGVRRWVPFVFQLRSLPSKERAGSCRSPRGRKCYLGGPYMAGRRSICPGRLLPIVVADMVLKGFSHVSSLSHRNFLCQGTVMLPEQTCWAESTLARCFCIRRRSLQPQHRSSEEVGGRGTKKGKPSQALYRRSQAL